jgi:cystathionine gamma-synthase
MKIETLAVHAGHTIDPSTGAVSAPIHLSTTFERDVEGSYSRGFMYTRNSNPNRSALEQGVSALEGGVEAAAFASGMGAAMALFQALEPGDHVLAHADAYYGMTRLLRDVFLKWGIQADFVDMSDLNLVRKAMRPNTKLAWTETPSNPLLKLVDLGDRVTLHAGGALCVCDNTWAPIIQRPIDLGVDLVLHSTTKYFGGHCDVLGGILVAKTANDFFERVRHIQYAGGAVPSPFDCWLILRGMRTLPWRMRAHSENAAEVAGFLEKHAKVERIHYPGFPLIPSRPREEADVVTRRNARSRSRADAMLRCWWRRKRSCSLAPPAWVERSLIEHRASIEGPGTTSPEGLFASLDRFGERGRFDRDLDQALG